MRVCNFNSSGTLYSGSLGGIVSDSSSLEEGLLESTSLEAVPFEDISSDRDLSGNDSLDTDFADTNFLETDTSDCKLAVLIQVRCTNGSSFVYNINPLSCHGIALIYTIARNGDFDKLAIP